MCACIRGDMVVYGRPCWLGIDQCVVVQQSGESCVLIYEKCAAGIAAAADAAI